jgi:BMFP domain-containing protein YqiC
MTKAETADGAADAFEVWRQMYETNERAWSEALEAAMSGPDQEAASGKLLETMLAAQKSIRTNMRTYLETMNVPTREDIARLGELVIGLEEKIDQLVDRFDALEDVVRTPGPAGPQGPTGATGAAGPKGPAGAKGAKGASGPKGATGAKGAIGAKGATGARGPAGAAARARADKPAATAKPVTGAKPAKRGKAL